VQLGHVVRALAPLHSVDVLAVRGGDQAYVERKGTVRILRVPTQGQGLRVQVQAFQRALLRQLDGADYDVVHCADVWSALPVLEARQRLGYAVVFDLTRAPPRDHAGSDVEFDAVHARDEAECVVGADLVLVPHELARRHAATRAQRGRVLLAPPGVDVDRFDWEDAAPTGPPRILYTGALEPGCGIPMLARAMVEVVKHSDAQLVLAGMPSPAFDVQFRTALADLGIADRVQCLGAIDHDQIPTLIATATVCVAPYAPELALRPYAQPPTKILEYLACRRAVVAPKRSSVEVVIQDDREGRLFGSDEPHVLAHALLSLLGDAQLRERLAQAGYQRVRGNFTASAARRALRSAYAELGLRFAARFAAGAVAAVASPDHVHAESAVDDDFDATVYEDLPAETIEALDDTGVSTTVDPTLRAASHVRADRSSEPPADSRRMRSTTLSDVDAPESAAAPMLPVEANADAGEWTTSPLPFREDWVLSGIVPTPHVSDELDGTPLDGLIASLPLRRGGPEHVFVAGEIDVPLPPLDETLDVGELTAASSVIAGRDDAPSDTGETADSGPAGTTA